MVLSSVISFLFHLGCKSSFLNTADQFFCLYFTLAVSKAAHQYKQSHILQRLSKSLHSTIFSLVIRQIEQLFMENENKLPFLSMFCDKSQMILHKTLHLLNQGTITWTLLYFSQRSFPPIHNHQNVFPTLP